MFKDLPTWIKLPGWPNERMTILVALFVLTWHLMDILKPAPGAEPSELFKALAQAIVLTGFLTAVGFFFTSSKGTAEANARVDKALDVAAGNATEGKQ